jgi:hypothetical protein
LSDILGEGQEENREVDEEAIPEEHLRELVQRDEQVALQLQQTKEKA